MKLRCKLGFHKWLVKCFTEHPFYSGPSSWYWRGCTLCHYDEYEIHRCGYHILATEFIPTPNLRDARQWAKFQHPSGWDGRDYTECL